MRFFILFCLSFQLLFSNTSENNLYKEKLIQEMLVKMEVDETIILGAMYSVGLLLNNSPESEVNNFITLVKIQKILDTKENSEKIKQSFIKSLKDFYSIEELSKRQRLKKTEVYERIAKDKEEIELVIDFTKIEISKLLIANSRQIFQVVGKK